MIMIINIDEYINIHKIIRYYYAFEIKNQLKISTV